jgi:RNA polymerase sigma-70 factor (ECF subfamily)
MLANADDAADATQESLVSAVRSLSRFDGRSSFGTWIYRIATNACIDELRRRRRRPLVGLEREGADEGPASGSGGTFGTLTEDPSDAAARRVDVDAALLALPLGFRTAVVLRDLCDLTYEEIARVLDVPVGTVRSRIARGRSALADLLGAPWNPPGSQNVKTQLGTEEINT